MKTDARGILFSIADRRLSQRLAPGQFERVLLSSILMEPQLVIPDIFFFNSPAIGTHIEKSRHGYSLLEEAVRAGIVIPAVREPANSFIEVEKYLRRDKIYGMLAAEETVYLAERLATATRSRFHPDVDALVSNGCRSRTC